MKKFEFHAVWQGAKEWVNTSRQLQKLKQHGGKCKRNEAQNSNNYNTQQIIRAQPAALAEPTAACSNPKWKQ